MHARTSPPEHIRNGASGKTLSGKLSEYYSYYSKANRVTVDSVEVFGLCSAVAIHPAKIYTSVHLSHLFFICNNDCTREHSFNQRFQLVFAGACPSSSSLLFLKSNWPNTGKNELCFSRMKCMEVNASKALASKSTVIANWLLLKYYSFKQKFVSASASDRSFSDPNWTSSCATTNFVTLSILYWWWHSTTIHDWKSINFF